MCESHICKENQHLNPGFNLGLQIVDLRRGIVDELYVNLFSSFFHTVGNTLPFGQAGNVTLGSKDKYDVEQLLSQVILI